MRRLQLADALPSALINRFMWAAIHEAPSHCYPLLVEAWMFNLATDHDTTVGDCLDATGWLGLRRRAGDWDGARY